MDGKKILTWAIGVAAVGVTVYVIFWAGSRGITAGKK